MKEKLKQFKPYGIGSIFTLLILVLVFHIYIVYSYAFRTARIEAFITSDGQEGLAIAIKKIVVESLNEREANYSPELESK